MTTASATIKNNILTLPEEMKPDWSEADVAICGDAKVLIVKKRIFAKRRQLSDFGKRLRAAGRSISMRDIKNAVRSVRRERSSAA